MGAGLSWSPPDGAVLASLRPPLIPALVDLEKTCSPVPWTAPQFEAELQKPYSLFKLLQRGESVLAYLGLWLVEGEAQIVNLAVHPQWRRRGVATGLWQVFLAEPVFQKVQRVSLEVRESNHGAQALYRRWGFHESSRRPGAYGGQETAVLMEKQRGRE